MSTIWRDTGLNNMIWNQGQGNISFLRSPKERPESRRWDYGVLPRRLLAFARSSRYSPCGRSDYSGVTSFLVPHLTKDRRVLIKWLLGREKGAMSWHASGGKIQGLKVRDCEALLMEGYPFPPFLLLLFFSSSSSSCSTLSRNRFPFGRSNSLFWK